MVFHSTLHRKYAANHGTGKNGLHRPRGGRRATAPPKAFCHTAKSLDGSLSAPVHVRCTILIRIFLSNVLCGAQPLQPRSTAAWAHGRDDRGQLFARGNSPQRKGTPILGPGASAPRRRRRQRCPCHSPCRRRRRRPCHRPCHRPCPRHRGSAASPTPRAAPSCRTRVR